MTLSPFSQIYHLGKLLKSVVTHSIRIKNCCLTSINYLTSNYLTSNNYFWFDGIVYQQVDRVAMGFPLSPSLVNAFLAHCEQIWLNDCPDDLKPVYYKRYANDIFVLFTFPHHFEKFNE